MKMNKRQIRKWSVSQLESLEGRNAPSHLGGLGHVAVALHRLHAAAQVSHVHDSRTTDRIEAQEKNSGADMSQDRSGTETNSNDPGRIDHSGSPDVFKS
jgi:hypothetical protein